MTDRNERTHLSVQTGTPKEKFNLWGYDRGAYLERSLYREMRRKVPVIDAAITKIRRLVGAFRIESGDTALDRRIAKFTGEVRTGAFGTGMDEFIGTFLEEMLTNGTAVGEIVVKDGHIAALYNTNLDDIVFREEGPLDVKICRIRNGEAEECRYPQLLLASALNPEPGKSTGVSMLRGLPFISDTLMKIYESVGNNWERLGNVRFAVSCAQDGSIYAPDRARMIADEWQKAMRKDSVSDFIAVGDVSIKAIGADISLPDSEVPVRQLLEQIVAKLGIPPFLLGFSWSSTERMSSQQADILTSELEYYRRMLNPVIKKVVKVWMALENAGDRSFEIIWDDITMQDESQHAAAELSLARAEKIRSEI